MCLLFYAAFPLSSLPIAYVFYLSEQTLLQDIPLANFDAKRLLSFSSFRHLDGSNIWLFQHPLYATCCSMKFSSFHSIFKITRQDTEYPLCTDSDHDHIEVYFSDVGLRKYLGSIIQGRNISEERNLRAQVMLQRLEGVFARENADGTPFETPGLPNQKGIQFSGDAWTREQAIALGDSTTLMSFTVPRKELLSRAFRARRHFCQAQSSPAIYSMGHQLLH